jgi:hypothetical protein
MSPGKAVTSTASISKGGVGRAWRLFHSKRQREAYQIADRLSKKLPPSNHSTVVPKSRGLLQSLWNLDTICQARSNLAVESLALSQRRQCYVSIQLEEERVSDTSHDDP